MQTSSWCRLSLVAVALLAYAEAAPPAQHVQAAPRADSVAAAISGARDSTWVGVTGPTLIAFYPPNAAALIDSAVDAATALDDFGYHLASATDSLRALGVRVVTIGSGTLHLVEHGRTTVFRVPRDSADLGYYLVAPGRAALVRYGVQADADLVALARQHLLGARTPPEPRPAP